MCSKQASRFVNALARRRTGVRARYDEGITCRQQLERKIPRAGDNIIISEMEHHATIVPRQMLCERKGARTARDPIAFPDGTLQLEHP